jgi:hypothetical protein
MVNDVEKEKSFQFKCRETYGGEHAAALLVSAAAPEEGDDDGGDGDNQEQDHRAPIRRDIHVSLK